MLGTEVLHPWQQKVKFPLVENELHCVELRYMYGHPWLKRNISMFPSLSAFVSVNPSFSIKYSRTVFFLKQSAQKLWQVLPLGPT
jgi:hypothetical protein